MISSSNRRYSKSSGQSARTQGRESAVAVKCKFCGNVFTAQPHRAVCVKCGRPANKSLEALWVAIAFFLPFLGLIYALTIRSHSPRAAQQGIKVSFAGVVVYTALYFVLHLVVKSI